MRIHGSHTRLAAAVVAVITSLVGTHPADVALAAHRGAPHVTIAGDTLVVDGTSGDDRILIGATGRADTVWVLAGGTLGRFGPVARIVVNAGDGNDRVVVDKAVTLPVRLNGGAGNDLLRGGAGPDLVFGEDGDDLLIGSPGRDALDTGPGHDRLIVPEPMGRMRVGAAAGGDVLRILSKAYTFSPLDGQPAASGGRAADVGPIVIGAADLGDESIVDLARASYQAGHAIALTGATADEAELLRGLLGHTSGAGWDASIRRVELVALRRAIRADGRLDETVTIVFPRVAVDLPPRQAARGRRTADARTIASLSAVFSRTQLVPDPAPGDDGPAQNLLNLANSYQSSGITSDDAGNSVQVFNSVWAVRSFQNQTDLYYLQQELDVEWGGQYPSPLRGWQNYADAFQRFQDTSILQPSPQSTTETTTETYGVSYTVGGSAGWNQMQGFNALGSGSVTISKSKTIAIPPIQIQNLTEFSQAWGRWTYQLNELPSDSDSISSFQSMLWEVPWSQYGAFTTLPYSTNGLLQFGPLDNPDYQLAIPQIDAFVPFPFGTVFAIQQPVVTSVTPTCAEWGDTFTITGTGLYPSLVTSVLIDSAPTQYSTVSDTQITAVAPGDTVGFELPVVVQTAQGLSNADVTIAIFPVCLSGAGGRPPSVRTAPAEPPTGRPGASAARWR